MGTSDIGNRIRTKLEQKMAQVTERLSELQDDVELRVAQGEVKAELLALEAEIEALRVSGEEARPGVRERLEAQRERLLARQEGLELKADLLNERRDRLQESLDEIRVKIQESVSTRDERGRVRRPPSQQASSRKMQDERRKILEMVQQGTITAGEAAQLLDALRTQEDSPSRAQRRPRWVRIRVTATNDDKVRVNLTLPVGLVRAGLRAGGSIAGIEGLDTAELEEMLDRGEIGHLLDVRDVVDGERIEIYVE